MTELRRSDPTSESVLPAWPPGGGRARRASARAPRARIDVGTVVALLLLVVGAAPELERQATDADNGRYNTDIEARFGEDRSLFDVEFEIAGNPICRPPGLENALSRKTDTGQAAIKGREALKRVLEIIFRQAACYRTTSERADMGAFFIGEIDGFQGNGRHIIGGLQCQKNLKGRQHT